MMPQSRDIPIEVDATALLYIDVQNFNTHRNGGEYKDMDIAEREHEFGYFFDQVESVVLPNMQAIQEACRKKRLEVMYTVIRSLTKDGRDRSLDYKITGFNVPPGSWDGEVVDELAPGDDEIVLPKTSSSVFISTHIDYILRNLGKRQLIICGFLSDQCIESAVRDACDLGYLVTLVTDACTTLSKDRHERTLSTIKGYCRQLTTAALLEELETR